MIPLTEGLPDAVVGLEATGEVESVDYETIAAPAVKRAWTSTKPLPIGPRLPGWT